MNLAHVAKVLARHRLLVTVGVVLSVLAAVFVYARPSFSGGLPTLTARTPEVWQASSVLFLTQPGFPAGRAVDDAAGVPTDQNRLSNLAVLYAELATSDRVRTLAGMRQEPEEDIKAEPVIHTIGTFQTPVVLPMVRISVKAATAAGAVERTQKLTAALRQFVTFGQSNAKIRLRDRVVLEEARQGTDPLLVSGPSKAVPIVVLALLVGLVLMVVFAYDNYTTEDEALVVGSERTGPRATAKKAERSGASTDPLTGDGVAALESVPREPMTGDDVRARPIRPGRPVLSTEQTARHDAAPTEVASLQQSSQ